MLIHTAGLVNDHERDQQDLQRILGVLADQQNSLFKRYCEELLQIALQVVKYYQSAYTPNELVLFILQNIGKNEVLAINHKNDGANVRRAGQPNALFTFAIGGNIVSRGLTFENLLTFYFSRNVKNRLQQIPIFKEHECLAVGLGLSFLNFACHRHYFVIGPIVSRTMSLV